MQPLSLVLVVCIAGGAVWWGVDKAGWLERESAAALRGATVQRGPLRISVIERGNLKAADSVVLKSEIEGQSTILKLVAEGIHASKGDC
jgi:hypothetical protein